MLESGLLSAVRIVKQMLAFDLSRIQDRVLIDGLTQSLRQIFFFSPELLTALNAIADGENIDIAEAEFWRDYFRFLSPEIADAFNYMQIERFERSNALMISDLCHIKDIQHGKVRIRSGISALFGQYIKGRDDPQAEINTREEAARIIAQVQRLNDSIEKLEKRVRSVRSGKPSAPRRTPPKRVSPKPKEGG